MNQKDVLKKVLLRIRPYWAGVAASLVLATVYVVMTLYIPILVGNAIDCIVDMGRVDFSAMKGFLWQVAVCSLIAAVSQWIMSQINNRMTYRVTRDIRDEAFRHIQVLPLSYLDAHPQGDVVSRVISDVDTFADGLLMGFTQLFTGVMTILGTLLFMLRLHWGIALVVIFVTPLSLVVANFIATRTYSMFRLQTVTRGEQTGLIDETIGQIKVVQAFGHQGESLEQFDEVNERLKKCSLRAIFFSSLTNPCTRFVNSVVYALVGLTGALAAIAGGITVGNLTSFLNYANQYTKPFNEISGVITELQNALACAGRVFELIEAPARSPEPENPQRPREVNGKVEIKDLRFSYVPEKPLIDDFQLSVEPGQRVAIVGPTGCGKTTFINLLMRFYDPQGGEIRLDGVNTRDMNRGELRRCVGMVLQDTWLKAGTIRENITMGKQDATEEQVIAAAKQAHAHSFILRLPQGYDTVIGESGGALSQGQKQLLCIARVMLCLPPMLFLDEATSSIDTRTEIKIQKAFNTMMEGRTSFIVAHRLSTIREADVILVMREGHIVEQGTHDELLRRNGFYAQLYQSQFAH
ncbi:MAG: ABC transporter ATP-binding protein [Candidatus Faecousia sp.]|nr:ABC transporter ATP-binding protein/permease [Clostridiales bacterium]MDY6180885.1 ABC transporter ATP-binding protein [Candidatus Faecousia sp.]